MAEPINLTAIAVGAMGVAGTVTSWFVNRRPQQADYASKLMDATIPAYETLAKRLAAVEAQNIECAERNERLERKCEHMIEYLRGLGLEVPGDTEAH